MTTSREMSKINKLREIIEKEKVISKVRLVMTSGISISYYEKLRPYLEEIYAHRVQYDKSIKIWKVVEEKEISSSVSEESNTINSFKEDQKNE